MHTPAGDLDDEALFEICAIKLYNSVALIFRYGVGDGMRLAIIPEVAPLVCKYDTRMTASRASEWNSRLSLKEYADLAFRSYQEPPQINLEIQGMTKSEWMELHTPEEPAWHEDSDLGR